MPPHCTHKLAATLLRHGNVICISSHATLRIKELLQHIEWYQCIARAHTLDAKESLNSRIQ